MADTKQAIQIGTILAVFTVIGFLWKLSDRWESKGADATAIQMRVDSLEKALSERVVVDARQDASIHTCEANYGDLKVDVAVLVAKLEALTSSLKNITSVLEKSLKIQ
jgi:hypothetical protein